MGTESYLLVNRIVEYVEQNIKRPINLDDIVANVNVSKYHLHRLFKALTGRSLIAYVRGRKVSMSLNELLYTNYSIIDIAFEYGFEYEQSYIRAFKAQYNLTPYYVRKHKPTLEYVQQIDISTLKRVANGFLFNPTFVIKPDFYLVGVESTIVHAENWEHFTTNQVVDDFLENHLGRIENVLDDEVLYALVTYTDSPEIQNNYMPSVEVNMPTLVEEPLELRAFETSEYAVFKYIGFHSLAEMTIRDINAIYECAFELIAESDVYEHSRPYHFERYDDRVSLENYCEAEVYYPIRRKVKECEGE